MNLYDNAWPHTYEEIRRFYPIWYRDVLEMDAIWRAQGAELDGVGENIERIIFNGYIHTADVETISKYEKFLELTPETSATLEERRECVAAAMFPTSHIGAPEIREIFGLFASGSIGVEFSAGIIDLIVDIADGNYLSVPAFLSILMRRIPTHLALRFTYQYSAGIKIKRIIDSWQYRVPECGTIRCGTWWMPSTLGWSEKPALSIGADPGPVLVSPELTGTLPHTKTRGWSVCGALRAGGVPKGFKVRPAEAGEPEKTGTLPETATAGHSITAGAVRAGGNAAGFKISPELAGTLPEIAVKGGAITGALSAGATVDGFKINPEYTGTLPEEAQHGEREG